jgi:peptide/nickel transport system ATP-binding protein
VTSPANPAPTVPDPILTVSDLEVTFRGRRGKQTPVIKGVSFELAAGETLSLVGESGSGKTTIGRAILGLAPVTGGAITFRGRTISNISRKLRRELATDIQVIFQDPYSSLNPALTIETILVEPLKAAGVEGGRTRVRELLDAVHLPKDAGSRYPREFSGGQRQRVAIARALAMNPAVIVCDEPTSALDVSVQAQILNLLRELQDKFGLAYLFITHNISVVEFLAHEVAVLYLGRIVERGSVDEVLNSPKHPYTRALLSAVPVIESSGREIIRLQGDLPSPANPPRGCHFHPRCPQAMPKCKEDYPAESRFSETHRTHCHLY